MVGCYHHHKAAVRLFQLLIWTRVDELGIDITGGPANALKVGSLILISDSLSSDDAYAEFWHEAMHIAVASVFAGERHKILAAIGKIDPEAVRSACGARTQKTGEGEEEYRIALLDEALALIVRLEGRQAAGIITIQEENQLNVLYAALSMSNQTLAITDKAGNLIEITGYISSVSEIQDVQRATWKILIDNDEFIGHALMPMASPAPEINYRNITLGGNWQGGCLSAIFDAVEPVWISAGSFAYKVWVDGDAVKFQRYDMAKDSIQDFICEFKLGQEFKAGRISGNYILPIDGRLERQHFSVKVSYVVPAECPLRGRYFKLEIKDLKSACATRVEYCGISPYLVEGDIISNNVDRLLRDIPEAAGKEINFIESGGSYSIPVVFDTSGGIIALGDSQYDTFLWKKVVSGELYTINLYLREIGNKPGLSANIKKIYHVIDIGKEARQCFALPVDITAAVKEALMETFERYNEEVSMSKGEIIAVTYAPKDPINVILAPLEAEPITLSVLKGKDLPSDIQFQYGFIIEPEEYYVVDMNTAKYVNEAQLGFMELKEGEELSIGTAFPGEFILNAYVASTHITFKRSGDTIFITPNPMAKYRTMIKGKEYVYNAGATDADSETITDAYKSDPLYAAESVPAENKEAMDAFTAIHNRLIELDNDIDTYTGKKFEDDIVESMASESESGSAKTLLNLYNSLLKAAYKNTETGASPEVCFDDTLPASAVGYVKNNKIYLNPKAPRVAVWAFFTHEVSHIFGATETAARGVNVTIIRKLKGLVGIIRTAKDSLSDGVIKNNLNFVANLLERQALKSEEDMATAAVMMLGTEKTPQALNKYLLGKFENAPNNEYPSDYVSDIATAWNKARVNGDLANGVIIAGADADAIAGLGEAIKSIAADTSITEDERMIEINFLLTRAATRSIINTLDKAVENDLWERYKNLTEGDKTNPEKLKAFGLVVSNELKPYAAKDEGSDTLEVYIPSENGGTDTYIIYINTVTNEIEWHSTGINRVEIAKTGEDELNIRVLLGDENRIVEITIEKVSTVTYVSGKNYSKVKSGSYRDVRYAAALAAPALVDVINEAQIGAVAGPDEMRVDEKIINLLSNIDGFMRGDVLLAVVLVLLDGVLTAGIISGIVSGIKMINKLLNMKSGVTPLVDEFSFAQGAEVIKQKLDGKINELCVTADELFGAAATEYELGFQVIDTGNGKLAFRTLNKDNVAILDNPALVKWYAAAIRTHDIATRVILENGASGQPILKVVSMEPITHIVFATREFGQVQNIIKAASCDVENYTLNKYLSDTEFSAKGHFNGRTREAVTDTEILNKVSAGETIDITRDDHFEAIMSSVCGEWIVNNRNAIIDVHQHPANFFEEFRDYITETLGISHEEFDKFRDDITLQPSMGDIGKKYKWGDRYYAQGIIARRDGKVYAAFYDIPAYFKKHKGDIEELEKFALKLIDKTITLSEWKRMVFLASGLRAEGFSVDELSKSLAASYQIRHGSQHTEVTAGLAEALREGRWTIDEGRGTNGGTVISVYADKFLIQMAREYFTNPTEKRAGLSVDKVNAIMDRLNGDNANGTNPKLNKVWVINTGDQPSMVLDILSKYATNDGKGRIAHCEAITLDEELILYLEVEGVDVSRFKAGDVLVTAGQSESVILGLIEHEFVEHPDIQLLGADKATHAYAEANEPEAVDIEIWKKIIDWAIIHPDRDGDRLESMEQLEEILDTAVANGELTQSDKVKLKEYAIDKLPKEEYRPTGKLVSILADETGGIIFKPKGNDIYLKTDLALRNLLDSGFRTNPAYSDLKAYLWECENPQAEADALNTLSEILFGAAATPEQAGTNYKMTIDYRMLEKYFDISVNDLKEIRSRNFISRYMLQAATDPDALKVKAKLGLFSLTLMVELWLEHIVITNPEWMGLTVEKLVEEIDSNARQFSEYYDNPATRGLAYELALNCVDVADNIRIDKVTDESRSYFKRLESACIVADFAGGLEVSAATREIARSAIYSLIRAQLASIDNDLSQLKNLQRLYNSVDNWQEDIEGENDVLLNSICRTCEIIIAAAYKIPYIISERMTWHKSTNEQRLKYTELDLLTLVTAGMMGSAFKWMPASEYGGVDIPLLHTALCGEGGKEKPVILDTGSSQMWMPYHLSEALGSQCLVIGSDAAYDLYEIKNTLTGNSAYYDTFGNLAQIKINGLVLQNLRPADEGFDANRSDFIADERAAFDNVRDIMLYKLWQDNLEAVRYGNFSLAHINILPEKVENYAAANADKFRYEQLDVMKAYSLANTADRPKIIMNFNCLDIYYTSDEIENALKSMLLAVPVGGLVVIGTGDDTVWSRCEYRIYQRVNEDGADKGKLVYGFVIGPSRFAPKEIMLPDPAAFNPGTNFPPVLSLETLPAVTGADSRLRDVKEYK